MICTATRTVRCTSSSTRRAWRTCSRKWMPMPSRSSTKRFIESRDMFWLATVDANGRPQCQYKGGAPGFVRVIDPKTIVFPSYDGNGRYHSMGNISATSHIGMLFLDFETPEPAARAGRRVDERGRSAAVGVQGRGIDRPCGRDGRDHQLPALHPQDDARGAVTKRAGRRKGNALRAVEADRHRAGSAARRRTPARRRKRAAR